MVGIASRLGTPEQIAEWFIKVKSAARHGMQINFYDFLPDLDIFSKPGSVLSAAARFLRTRRKQPETTIVKFTLFNLP